MANGEVVGSGREVRSGEDQDAQGSGAGSPFPSFPDQKLSRSDMRLLGQAVRKRWEIPDEAYRVVPQVVAAAARGIQIDPVTGARSSVPIRTRLLAANTLAAMKAQNDAMGPEPVQEEVDDGEIDACLDAMTLDDLRRLAGKEIVLRVERTDPCPAPDTSAVRTARSD